MLYFTHTYTHKVVCSRFGGVEFAGQVVVSDTFYDMAAWASSTFNIYSREERQVQFHRDPWTFNILL